ncbi:hypothetical protein TIFTF001_021386 [Ficus carica]|uniref:NIM1-interacting protein n=1 Tax=Ficus carica TaxID=3494 RepID=A0AA88DDL6_FICCA|nr:hypothetical protein TIFTF001_021386 [Ficus carica]
MNGSKKRKLNHELYINNDEEELATEEQKFEKFYALIRSMREARDRLIMINGAAAAGPPKINIHPDHHHDLHDQYSQLKYVNNVDKRKKLIMNGSTATTSTAEEQEKNKDSINTKIINGEVNLFKVPNSLGISSSSPSLLIAPDDQKEDRRMMSSTNDGLDLTLSL